LIIFSAREAEYTFKTKLDQSKEVNINDKLMLKCTVDNSNAQVDWYKDTNEKIRVASHPHILTSNNRGEITLRIKKTSEGDSGKYTCKISKFGKKGENETSCDVTVKGK
jgi:hypothetical protein